jgi:hypothetical protein
MPTLLNHAFPVGVFQFTLAPQEILFVPATNKANMLRGAFGHAFRRLCCIPQCKDAHHCPVASSCPYKSIFEPSPPAEAQRLSRNQDIPRPFVFRAPASEKTKFHPGEEFEFGLVLIGRALDYLPYFVLSFRELAAQGLGLNRAKCELKSVCETSENALLMAVASGSGPHAGQQECCIYNSKDQVFQSPKGLDLSHWIAQRAAALSGNGQISIRFLTPTLLKSENNVKRQPEFHHLLKRLRDRINALSTFFGSGPLDADFAGLGQRAGQVRTVSCDVQWIEQFRRSSKTHQRHELSGFTGAIVCEGDLEEFLPWLAVGELVHVGKHTAWGSGRVAVSKNS